MIKYFKELLKTLKKIEQNTEEIKKAAKKVSGCIGTSRRGGNCIVTKDWNS